jgi:hypothetical protein
MLSIAILREVKQLYSVSDRLDSLAEQYLRRLRSTEALKHSSPSSGSVRNAATLLQVLVAGK